MPSHHIHRSPNKRNQTVVASGKLKLREESDWRCAKQQGYRTATLTPILDGVVESKGICPLSDWAASSRSTASMVSRWKRKLQNGHEAVVVARCMEEAVGQQIPNRSQQQPQWQHWGQNKVSWIGAMVIVRFDHTMRVKALSSTIGAMSKHLWAASHLLLLSRTPWI